MAGLIEDKEQSFKSVLEINNYLRYNVYNSNIISNKNRRKIITLRDLEELKNSRDYLNKLFQTLTQVIRN